MLSSMKTQLNTMSLSLDKVLVDIGCGPGIGVTTAGIIAAHSFDKNSTHRTQRPASRRIPCYSSKYCKVSTKGIARQTLGCAYT